MPASLSGKNVTVVLLYRPTLPYDDDAMTATVESVLAQDGARIELIVVDDRGSSASPDFLPERLRSDPRLCHLPGSYANRSAMWNAAIERATGSFIVLAANDQAQVRFKRSAVRGLVITALRDRKVGMVASDYERIDQGGRATEVHLLAYHEGRVRDAHDVGLVQLLPRKVLDAVGRFNESYTAGDFYDLRLRVSERYRIVHVANRYAGSLYSVVAPPKEHNVFDYLLVGKDAQRELEAVLTEHLRRIGACLAPGANFHEVTYTDVEKKRFEKCVASVVIPVNHRPRFIGTAIESVLNQTVRNVEVIVVVNGGEQDPTIPAVQRYLKGGEKYDASKPPVRLLVLDVNNLGICLNSGIDVAAGKYYVQLDSDDRLKPEAVETLVKVFDSDPTIGMVIGSYEVWDLNEATGQITRNPNVPVVTHDEWTAENGRNNLLRVGGAGAPRSAHVKVIRDVGWFGTNDIPDCRNYGEDYDLVHRIAEKYNIGRVWEPIYDVIRHSGGTDHSIDQVTIDRNENAKDNMRREAIHRRIAITRRMRRAKG